MATEEKEDYPSRMHSGVNGNRNHQNDGAQNYARTVDFTGAVTRFDQGENGSTMRTKTGPSVAKTNIPFDSSDDDLSFHSAVKRISTDSIDSSVIAPISSPGRVTFAEDCYGNMNGSRDDNRTSSTRSSIAKNPFDEILLDRASYNGNVDAMRMKMEAMERKMLSLQSDVAKFSDDDGGTSGTFGNSVTYASHRRSDMVRTSLILKDIHFLSEDIAGSDSKYPLDCYSLVALNGPVNYKWPKQELLFFLFGFMVFSFQICFLALMIFSRVYMNAADIDSDNPINQFLQFIPANSKHVIRVSQVVALLTYILFPDASLMDVFKSYQYYPSSKRKVVGDRVVGMKISCYLRGFQGYLATIAVFIVVITTRSVVDIILNFTALSFISSLDDEAFDLAKSGVFGSDLRKEIERIENAKLPACMTPDGTVRLYWKVMGSTAAVMFLLLFCVIGFQNSASWWVTPTFRVEFREETGLKPYSGCYEINSNSKFFNRFAYVDEDSDVAFGYCTDDKRYVLFSGFEENLNPCDTENGIARSTETEFFDIASSFEELWFYADTTTPIGLFFFPETDIENLHCDMTLGDGICDQPFNTPGYQYDNGDCCAATCTEIRCGIKGYTSIFGNKNISANGYPHCQNPQMLPITIRLNDIVSSRDAQFGIDPFSACELDLAKGEEEWRAEPPAKPLMYLFCNGAYVLTLNVDESMKYNTETFWIEDGAACSVGIGNSTSDPIPGTKNVDLYSFYCDEPIWFVNYTIFHGPKHPSESDQIEIVTKHSSENDWVDFTRVPECYFSKLGKYVDMASIYSASNPSYDVIHWLLNDDNNDELLQCENQLFIERFALATVVFEMNGNVTKLDNDDLQCSWLWIDCSDLGQVDVMNLQSSSLKGEIPNELILLANLRQLDLYNNQITSIPSEIGFMGNLEKLLMHDNIITSIPREIGWVKNLQTLWLNDNQIKHVPSEIGMLTNLRDLELANNDLATIPTEIGLMTSLNALWLGENDLKSIPTEIGMLTDLEVFWSRRNELSSLPIEFGLLTNLEAVSLSSNKFVTFPLALVSLTNMKEQLYLGRNQIISIPSEIGRMTSLERLYLDYNNITSIPSEIGKMSSVERLNLNNNQLTSIPTEIGLLTNLRYLYLSDNQLTSIPSEIGSLKKLVEFKLSNNDIGSIPQEVEELCSSVNDSVVCEIGTDSSSQSIFDPVGGLL